MRTRISRLAIVAALLAPAALPAQHAEQPRVSVHVLLGALLPTGDHQPTIDNAFTIGGQVGLRLRTGLALVGGVLGSQSAYRDGMREDLTVVQYDLGLELAPWRTVGRAVPFLGLGAGARSYDERGGSTGLRFVPAGYVSVGGELAMGRSGLRVEARDYLSRAETRGMMGGARNDVTLLAGLAFHFR